MSPEDSLPENLARGKLYSFLLGLSGIKRHFRRKLFSGGYPDQPDPPPGSLSTEFRFQEDLLQGRKVWTISPRTRSSRRIVLYLHGGAYVANINTIHWELIQELIRSTNCTVVLPDYPLAPKDNWLQTYGFLTAAYHQLLQDSSPQNLVFMGDSAGAGLALGFAQLLKNQDGPLPDRIILLSPWLDVTLTNPAIPELAKQDRMLDLDALVAAGKAYAGDLDAKDYRISPLYGDLQGLPRISLFIGTRELLLPDARKFKELMDERGIHLDYFEYPGMFHAWVAITRLPEARQAMEQISELLLEPGNHN
jgi:acetyl esterase/lipase